MTTSTVAVSDIMTRNVLFAKPEQGFAEIARLFAEMDIHHLPVTDKAGKLIGIISANDVMRGFSRRLFNSADGSIPLDQSLTVADLMTSSPVYLCPANSIQKAAELFARHRIQCLPVVEGTKVVGIITTRDLVKHFADI
ncbi:MAG: CBS domain-containing protein [Phaeodactylibacter sp.]|uniref:CBS domain-containing protein n=1 Tax=Phaeodactylibacter sp. TaxID=1940289 RepID=UPI0032F05796